MDLRLRGTVDYRIGAGIIVCMLLVGNDCTTESTAPEPGSATLSDNFNSGCDAWSASETIVSGSGTTSETCPSSGGSDGGRYRLMTHELPDLGSLNVYHTFTGGTVRVGGDALCGGSIRFEERRAVTAPAYTGAAVGANVFVVQNGIRYLAKVTSTFTETTWTSYVSGDLAAADFSPAGLDLCPGTATELSFGYYRWNSNTGGGTVTNVHGIDQWSVTVIPK
jgi:hypothetical protein